MDKTNCCDFMTRALVYSRKQSLKLRPYRLPGLVRAIYLNPNDGALKGNPILYNVPAMGRGFDRVHAKNSVVNFCPFCGAKQQELQVAEVALETFEVKR